jgi:fumarylacetoacetate (FAA) hydrolase
MRGVPLPLPRAYQWIDGSAYVNHVELVRKARGADMPEASGTIP